ncbi:PREDICTED: ATP synthase subunit g, mitochondrial-like [Nicrophorus vespilloides]|uniref:ATP synthase subunit g n=1 Tax=Nicrophorus vespilloides TaxID=110193 RepID=A0ABM1M9C3_NICVS|nr:PREDICTED: ATP synthase subunit g, mitochondrial-like [Nicrophorus vespilloides]
MSAGKLDQLWVVAKPKLLLFLKYAKVELVPPSPLDIPKIMKDVSAGIKSFKSGSWKETPVREAWLNTLVTVEVFCWFYVGECIGKRHIVGYDV